MFQEMYLERKNGLASVASCLRWTWSPTCVCVYIIFLKKK